MKIGLALGSGSSRGWSHIGIIRALKRMGIVPDIVCGTSIGALVGASYVSNKLEQLENWINTLTKLEIAKFYNLNPSNNGLVNIERLKKHIYQYVTEEDSLIENTKTRFATVSTDLETGREIWHQDGPIIDAVLSSIALPGIFAPNLNRKKWLVDGGLVNPVPTSVCRALGAEVVIAVNLNNDIVGKHFKSVATQPNKKNYDKTKFGNLINNYKTTLFLDSDKLDKPPSYFETIAGAINIFQDRITKSRMVGDPPDVLLSPKLSQISLLDFHKASEAISEGEACVKRAVSELQYYINEKLQDHP